MACEAWLKGAVPTAYATQTLRVAETSLQEEEKAIAEQQAGDAAELRASLAGQARKLGQVIAQMRAAIERRDVGSLAPLLKQLEADEQALKALNAGGGARP